MNRTEILKKANECVMGDREQDYGSPEDNFERIAKLWSAYTGHEYTSLEVAMMLGLVKVGRAASGRLHIDNFIDLAGYAACAGEIAANEREYAERKKVARSNPPDVLERFGYTDWLRRLGKTMEMEDTNEP